MDHKDPETKLSSLKTAKRTSFMWSLSKARLAEELAKGQVLCHACHLAKTSEERAATRSHGQTLYRLGCRCHVYRASQVARMARYRARRAGSATVGPGRTP